MLDPNQNNLLLESVVKLPCWSPEKLAPYLASSYIRIAKQHIQALLTQQGQAKVENQAKGAHDHHTMAKYMRVIKSFFTDAHKDLLVHLGKDWLQEGDVIIAVSKQTKQLAGLVPTGMLVALAGSGSQTTLDDASYASHFGLSSMCDALPHSLCSCTARIAYSHSVEPTLCSPSLS